MITRIKNLYLVRFAFNQDVYWSYCSVSTTINSYNSQLDKKSTSHPPVCDKSEKSPEVSFTAELAPYCRLVQQIKSFFLFFFFFFLFKLPVCWCVFLYEKKKKSLEAKKQSLPWPRKIRMLIGTPVASLVCALIHVATAHFFPPEFKHGEKKNIKTKQNKKKTH